VFTSCNCKKYGSILKKL